MNATKWISFRLDAQRFARVNELSASAGTRSEFLLSAVDLSDALIRAASMMRDHGMTDADMPVVTLFAEINTMIADMVSVQNDHDPGWNPDRGENPLTLIGLEVSAA